MRFWGTILQSIFSMKIYHLILYLCFLVILEFFHLVLWLLHFLNFFLCKFCLVPSKFCHCVTAVSLLSSCRAAWAVFLGFLVVLVEIGVLEIVSCAREEMRCFPVANLFSEMLSNFFCFFERGHYVSKIPMIEGNR